MVCVRALAAPRRVEREDRRTGPEGVRETGQVEQRGREVRDRGRGVRSP